MTLDDVDPKAFGLMVAWLYTQQIEEDDLNITGVPNASAINSHYPLDLIKLWELEGRYIMPSLQNRVVRKLMPVLRAAHSFQFEKAIMYAYEQNLEPLKRFAVYILAFEIDDVLANGIADSLPRDILADAMKLLKTHCWQYNVNGLNDARRDPAIYFV
jgi:hypothetical protein